MVKNNLCAFLAGVVILCSCKGSGQSVRLAMKYATGDNQRIAIETITEGSSRNMKSIISLQFVVDSVKSNGTACFSVKPKRIYSHLSIDGESETYDSDKGTIAAMHRSFYDAAFSLQIDRQGKIVLPLQYAGTKQSASGMFEMRRVQLVFPDREMNTGDSWKDEYKNEFTSSTIKGVYTLTAITDTSIVIKMDGTMIDGFGMLPPRKLTGQYTLEKNTCRLLNARLEATLSGGGKFIQRMYAE